MKCKRLLALVVTTTLTLTALPVGAAQASPTHKTAPTPGQFYLALGDSLAVGYQPDPTVAWTHGWVYQFDAMLNRVHPVALTDIGINGECTSTFIAGGLDPACPTKEVDSPSQLAEAVSFLKGHPGLVNPVTINIGANNLQSVQTTLLTGTDAQRQAVLAPIFPKLAKDWVTIFTTLRQACPKCEIIAVNLYNPIPAGVLKFDARPVFTTYNSLLKQAAAVAKVRVADVYTPFVGHELFYTWISQRDNHPTNTGYTVMAETVAKTSGIAIPAQ